MPRPDALRVSMMRSIQQNAGEAELIDAITAASAFVGDEPASADTSFEDGGDDAEAYEDLSDEEVDSALADLLDSEESEND